VHSDQTNKMSGLWWCIGHRLFVVKSGESCENYFPQGMWAGLKGGFIEKPAGKSDIFRPARCLPYTGRFGCDASGV